MNWEKKYEERDNFILVRERHSDRGFLGPLVIRTSGYAIKKITPRKVQKAYCDMDCNVYSLYLKPECKVNFTQIEFARLFEKEMCRPYMKGTALVGYSEGATFLAEATRYLENPANILLIAPAAKGNKELDLSKLAKHNVIYVSPKYQKNSNIFENTVKSCKKFLLKKNTDIQLQEQNIPENLVKKAIRIGASQETALEKANPEILYFLYDAFF